MKLSEFTKQFKKDAETLAAAYELIKIQSDKLKAQGQILSLFVDGETLAAMTLYGSYINSKEAN